MIHVGGHHEYIGGMIHVGGYHEYIKGCSVHWRDFMTHVGDITNTSRDVRGGYHEYIGGSSVYRKDVMSTLGDIMIHVVDIMSTSRGVQYIEG